MSSADFEKQIILTDTAAHRQTKMEKVKSQIYVRHILVDATWEGLTFSKIVIFCVAPKSQ